MVIVGQVGLFIRMRSGNVESGLVIYDGKV
jgi:hypothetical protein